MAEPNIIQELPTECDSCKAAYDHLRPITQSKTTPLGTFTRVVGYTCIACDTSHLYRIMPGPARPPKEVGTSTGLVLPTTLSDIPHPQTEDQEDE